MQCVGISYLCRVKQTDAERLRREYSRLVEGLAQSMIQSTPDQFRAEPGTLPSIIYSCAVLSNDVLLEVVPGNIRRAEHFLGLMKRLVEYLKSRLRTNNVVSQNPLAFLQHLYQQVQIEPRVMRYRVK